MPTSSPQGLNGAVLSSQSELEKKLIEQHDKIESWFETQWSMAQAPFYGSVDLRNAGFKLAPVDTNLFPAGFNNLSPDDIPLCAEAMQATIAEICPDVTRVLILPENHSRNLFYFESLATLAEILEQAGLETRIGSLDTGLNEAVIHRLPSGRTVKIEPIIRENDHLTVMAFKPCCIVLNNDLSNGVPPALEGLAQAIMPATTLGWGTRLKSEHFHFYQKIVESFAPSFDIDPWLLNPLFDQCPEVDFMKREGQACLVKRSEALLKNIQKKYDEYGIEKKPFLAVKADAGTYGMAVMMIQDPQELYELNRKQRTRMSMAKGGAHVTKAIIQEGVPTIETMLDDGAVAEPVLYAIGRQVVGGFYRTHAKRGDIENLNTPGMQFRPFNIGTQNSFYAYRVVSRLALLAAAQEQLALKKRSIAQPVL